MIETEMVSASELFNNNRPMTPNPSVSTKNSSVIKSLRQFTETLDIKHNISVRRFGASKANCKAIK